VSRAAPALLAALVVLCGCISALKEPPSLEELAGGSRELSPEEIRDLSARADAKFESRKLPAVRDAASLWTEVAQASPDDLEALISALRARIWLAEHDTGSRSRERESTMAVQTGQWCQRRAPDDPRCAYWLGAALGVQARERRGTALDALPRIEELFAQAAEADPLIDDAGPHRALALLYLRAPGWPSGPGDPERGLEHAQRAFELRPAYAPNLLALGEAMLALQHPNEAREAYERALVLAEDGSERGVPDAPGWADSARKGVNSVHSSGARK
jgi:tetratricopeptide (TPR) repeat protein